MEIQVITEPLELLFIDNPYSDAELDLIWKEIDLLQAANIFLPPEETGSAKTDDGVLMKKNKAVFLDGIYSQRTVSPLLTFAEKLLTPEVKEAMAFINPSHGIFGNANHHTTLLSYYEESDHYDFHFDTSAYTTLSYFFQEPKMFSGGEIVFKAGDSEIEFPMVNNFSIVFPSCYSHAVRKIKMKKQHLNKGLGRYCLTQFVGIGLL